MDGNNVVVPSEPYDPGSSCDELTFDEWQFVSRNTEQGSSDEESIEIIEREVLAPERISSYSISPNEGKDDLHSLGTVNEWNPIKSTQIDELTSLASNTCGLSQIRKANSLCCSCFEESPNTLQKANITWKFLQSFIAGLLAGFLFLQYKDYIYDKWSDFSIYNYHSNDFIDKQLWTFLFGIPENQVISRDNLGHNADNSDDFLKRLTKYFENQKMLTDNKLMDHINLLKTGKQMKDDIYIFYLFKLTSVDQRIPRPLSKYLKSVSLYEISPCRSNITKEQLPVLCEHDRNVMVLIDKQQLISAQDLIKEFVDVSRNELTILHDNVWNVLTSPLPNPNDMKKDLDAFATDCDNFSKQYKSTLYCVKRNHQHIEDPMKKCAQLHSSISQENGENFSNKFSWSQFTGGSKINDRISSNIEVPRMLKDLAVNFKEDIEKFYRLYISPEENGNNVPKNTDILSPDSNKINSTDTRETETLPKKMNSTTSSMSGEWFFNLSKARANIRSYYDNLVKGDWLLKLGKAREKAREQYFSVYNYYRGKNEDKKEEKETKRKETKKKRKEFSKNNKKFTMKLKHMYKKLEAKITDSYKNMKINIKQALNEWYHKRS